MPNDRKIRRQVKRALKRGDITVSDPNNVTPKDDGPNWITPPQVKQKKSKNTFSPQDAFKKMNNPGGEPRKKVNKRQLKKFQKQVDKVQFVKQDTKDIFSEPKGVKENMSKKRAQKKEHKGKGYFVEYPAFKYSGDSPAMRKLSASCKAAARAKFDVYPSAYANMWASKQQGKGKC